MRGFATLTIILSIAVIVLLAGSGYFLINRNSAPGVGPSPSPIVTATPEPTPLVTPTPSPIVTPKPTVRATTKPTSTPTAKPTVSPTPSPTPEVAKTGCATYNLGGDLGKINITLKPMDGKSIEGDTLLTIKRKYSECQGVDPGWPLSKVLSQGQTQTEFGGMRPGPFVIDVMYHGKTSSYDIDVKSGDNSLTVTAND